MKKKLLVFMIMGVLTTACGAKDTAETMEPQLLGQTTLAELGKEPAVESVQLTEQEEESAAAFSFGDLKGLEFYFASGAGGWRTVLEIEEDGSFSGVHSDSDMGDAGEGYPGGTCYVCQFQGQFTEPEKVNDYTYSVKIQQLKLDHEPETEEIVDGVRYCYSTAYGIDGAEEILIYLPGAPCAKLPQEYRNWVRNDMVDPDAEELPFYGLYNVKEQNGFSSYDTSRWIQEMMAAAEEQSDELQDSLMHDSLNQGEMNEKAAQLYQIWDDVLNRLWAELKDTLPEEEFQQLLDEQRAWIVRKEQAVKEAGEEFAGGSMYGMVVNSKAADITQERVYQLYELLE